MPLTLQICCRVMGVVAGRNQIRWQTHKLCGNFVWSIALFGEKAESPTCLETAAPLVIEQAGEQVAMREWYGIDFCPWCGTKLKGALDSDQSKLAYDAET